MPADGTVEELRAEVARLGKTVQALTDSAAGIAIVEEARFTFVNARLAETFGYQPDGMLYMPALETIAHSSRPHVSDHVRDCLAGRPHPLLVECEGLRRDGSSVYIELSSSCLVTGDSVSVVWVVTDITARKLAERKVKALERRVAELAIRDSLTGLYNRGFTEASLERDLIQAERSKTPLTVVMCDVDRLRLVNETFGRESGDEVLKALGSLLKRRCRKSDVACRYGGEEFMVIFPGMPAEVATQWAEKLRAVIAGVRVTRDSISVPVTASFGVATYPQHGQTWQDLIRAADAAQYTAGAAGGNQVRAASPSESTSKEWLCPAPTPGTQLESQDLALLLAREM